MAEIESNKSLGQVYAPFDCVIRTANDRLRNDPDLINSDPYSDGWLAEIKTTGSAGANGLNDAVEYKSILD